MADLFGDEPKKKDLIEELCFVYLLYFDEKKGHAPLLIYPNEKYKDNKKIMRPINFHPIWFFEIEEQDALDHVDVEYKGYTYFGKKFLTKSGRIKKRAGLDQDTPETIILIMSLPNDLVIFGDELIRILNNKIIDEYGDKLTEIIEYLDAKDEIIKTPKIKETIKNGFSLKNELYDIIYTAVNEFFNNTIKDVDHLSIKKQKAISFLALKGINVSHIVSNGGNSFQDIKLFDPKEGSEGSLSLKTPYEISRIKVIEDSNELEIMLINNNKEEQNDLVVKINYLEDFFEREILMQEVDFWFPEEEILFLAPIVPDVDEYLLFIINKANNKKILSKKIDIAILDSIKS